MNIRLHNSTLLHSNALAQGSPNYGLRTKNLAREAISSGPQIHFVNNEKVIHLRKICWFGRM